MPDADPVLLATILPALAALWAVWWLRLREAPSSPLADSMRRVSWAFIAVYFTWKAFFYVPRESVLDLVTSGLSASNRIEAAFTVLAASWAGWLVLSRRVPFARLLYGAGFWATLLIALYMLSTLWSVWPELTAYKALELCAFWVIVAHAFAVGPWRDNQEWLALWAVIGDLLPHIIGGDIDLSGGPVGAFYDNGGATMAGALFLVGLHRLLSRQDLRARVLVVFALVAMLLFHSFATYLSVVAALPALLVLVLVPQATRAAMTLMIFGTLTAGGLMSWLAVNAEPDLLFQVGNMAGKDAAQMGSMTGRLPLWEVLWEISRNHALGTGFLAVERMIPEIVSVDMVGWIAAHSHNGFLSAWLAGGYLGLGVILSFTVALCLQAVRMGASGRALAVPFLLFVLINNMSYPAFGGRLNGAWLMVMGLAFATAARPARITVPAPAAPAFPRIPARPADVPALGHSRPAGSGPYQH